MGIESDQIVFDYLSRVGDLAQQRQLPSATRMRLVSELRGEIDKRRAKVTVDSPAAVRRIIDRLGSPDDIVTGAQDGTAPDPAETLTRPVPEQPGAAAPRRRMPRPRRTPAPGPEDPAPSPPHLAGTDELGTPGGDTDWWRLGEGGAMPLGESDSVPGFVGGVEIPELLKPPPRPGDKRPDLRKKPVEDEEPEAEEETEEAAPRKRRGLPRLAAPAGGLANPVLMLAALVLVVGAVLGNILVLLIGWAVVFLSRRLTEGQKKWAVFVLPGAAAAAGIVWLWGRTDGRWGEPVADGRMSAALGETWPWVLRGAAIASALYLVWRSRRQR
ncbi:hypothetical protein [Streptomyces xanthii]|uniref:Uncharacterized protein n=1 Tax=Streptomyces xanthii TaxID=2768069 RepID=A0A7H1B874_9ACTN|nr:hypothetical protein [Streptomyces xanthii]QNS04929.1 hypothetical protein IAG42_15800 [Streptomyces xanthii]